MYNLIDKISNETFRIIISDGALYLATNKNSNISDGALFLATNTNTITNISDGAVGHFPRHKYKYKSKYKYKYKYFRWGTLPRHKHLLNTKYFRSEPILPFLIPIPFAIVV